MFKSIYFSLKINNKKYVVIASCGKFYRSFGDDTLVIYEICNKIKRRIKKKIKYLNDKSRSSYKGYFKYSNIKDVNKLLNKAKK